MTHRQRISFGCAIGITAALLAFAGEKHPTAADTGTYILGPGDIVTLQSMDCEDISGKPVRIDQEGYLSLPLVGRVSAGGLTTAGLEESVAAKLRQFLRSPVVTVSITQFGSQPVSILGAVGAPGTYQLQGPKTISEVLALASGLAPDAGDTLRLVRKAQYGPILVAGAREDAEGTSSAELRIQSILDSTVNIAIRPFDLISVAKSKSIFVVGEVQKPGQVVLGSKPGISVLEAVSMAQGFQKTAAPKKARILRMRPDSDEREDIAVNLDKILESKEPNVMLKPDDILFVPNNLPKNMALRGLEAAIQMGTGVVIWRQAR